MVLVLVTLYTATTTANITAVVLASTINGLPDLPGKSVVTWVDCELKTPSLSLSRKIKIKNLRTHRFPTATFN